MLGAKKTVAILGAGPSGLVAAKSMLEAGLLPTVFDKAGGVGGLWNPKHYPCWNSLRTNLSRFTCAFSDFSWNQQASMFPTQAEMFGYFKGYADKFIPAHHFLLNSRVTSIRESGVKDEKNWIVQWTSLENGDQFHHFDYVVVATGFFSAPYTPLIKGLSDYDGISMHSSEYRSPEIFSGKRVAVVGASFSAAEVAAEISPYSSELVHIISRPFWAIPRYIPLDSKNPATPFFPVDFVFYRRSTRKSFEEVVLRTEKDYDIINSSFRKMCGERDLASINQDFNTPPIVTISDEYTLMLHSCRIKTHFGRVGEVSERRVILHDGTAFNNVDAIVFCTGYRPSLPFFASDILDILSFDPNDSFSPLLLHHTTFHHSFPRLAFVGMYRGPYMAIAELQARWAAGIFSGFLPPVPASVQIEGIAKEKQIREQSPRPQFPHPDYVGFSYTIANILDIHPPIDWNAIHSEIVTVSDFAITSEPAKYVLSDLERECQLFLNGKMVAAIAFRSLQGTWDFHREIVSQLEGTPSGKVIGRATFCWNSLSKDYLYSEVGEFVVEDGLSEGRTQVFDVRKNYVWTYDEEQDLINVFFEKDGGRGELFNTLNFVSPSCQDQKDSQKDFHNVEILPEWKAISEHLCSQDTYKVKYLFAFEGLQLSRLDIVYNVIGPNKNYMSKTLYIPTISC